MIDLDIRLAARLRITQLSRETRRVLRRILAFLATLGLVVASTNTHAYARASSSETAHRGFASVAASTRPGEALASAERIKEKVVGAAGRTSRLTLGEQFDANAGFYYLRARYYDPATGRFPTMDTYRGRNAEPVTLHKYLYGNVDPVNHVDPSGHFAAIEALKAVTVAAVLVGAATAAIKIGMDNATATTNYPGRRPEVDYKTIGLLAIMNLSRSGARIGLDALTRKQQHPTVDLFRAVEEGEMMSINACQCFSPGRNMFPKQFWLTAQNAIQFGEQFIKKFEPGFDVVWATISRNMFNALDHAASDPGIGPIVTVPDPLLPAFNEDVTRHGGIRHAGHY